jgi:tRNA A-37 threonylcarbamoyl transferase component Bud32
VQQRTVLDLGASAGFFALWALREGAKSATCVDMDPAYVEITQSLSKHFGIENLTSVHANVDAWETPADIVIALALVHWLYSCTSTFGSLDAVIGKLAALTNYMLVVEWIDPDDGAVQWFGHVRWNADLTDGRYDVERFEAALAKHFVRFTRLGPTMEHRSLYVAYKTASNVDLANPLPMLQGRGEVIASRLLASVASTNYWSRVYEDKRAGSVTKQATLDLAERESKFLSRLDSDYFPKITEAYSEDQYSVLTMERVEGRRLADMAPEIRESFESIIEFCLHCINILDELSSAEIWHRDIHLDNMLIYNDKPVLLDFGWAISKDIQYDNPEPLFVHDADNDGVHFDTYMMGKVIESVNSVRHEEVALLAELMCNDRSSLRLTDLGSIRSILLHLRSNHEGRDTMNRLSAAPAGHVAVEDLSSPSDSTLAGTLFEQVVARNRRIAQHEERLAELEAALSERDRAIAEIDGQRVRVELELRQREEALAGLQDELQRRDAELDGRRDTPQRDDGAIVGLQDEVKQRDIALATLREELLDRDRVLAATQQELLERGQTLETLNRELGSRDATLQDLRIQIAAIYNSRVWRLARVFWSWRRRTLRLLGRS